MEKIESQFERLACIVCGKPPGLSGADCHKSVGQRNPLCQGYTKCRIEEKSEQQLDYALCPISGCVFLEACPGSGKTEVVGLKAAYEIRQWQRSPSGIAILTFTNNAAEVIRARVRQFVGADKIGFPHYVGTIDSWLHGYIANPFAHIVTAYAGGNGDYRFRVVEDKDNGTWLNAFSSKTPYCVLNKKKDGSEYVIQRTLCANRIRLELDGSTFSLLSPTTENYHYVGDEDYYGSEAFSQYRAEVPQSGKPRSWIQLRHIRAAFGDAKERFWKAGFATYQDVEYICLKLIAEQTELSNRIARRFPLIIVDECQDLSEAQLRILGSLRDSGVVMHLVGDVDQAIHSFRDVDSTKVKSFVETNKFVPLKLAVNFRSYQPIVNLCSTLIGRSGITGRQYEEQQPACVCFGYESGNETDLVKRFVEYLKTRNIDVHSSAILARGDSTLRRLRPGFDRKRLSDAMRVPTAMHLWRSQNPESRNDAVSCIGHFVASRFYSQEHADSRQYSCPKSLKSPLRWRLMLSRVLDACLKHEELSNMTLVWKEWLKVLNSDVVGIVTTHCEGADSSVTLKFKSPDGLSGASVADSLETVTANDDCGIRIGTIHSAKGETLDAVMLVSSRSKSGNVGGHWEEWLDATRDGGEHTRFAFVGSSRPRYLLAWAVPSPKPNDEKRIRELGFTILQ